MNTYIAKDSKYKQAVRDSLVDMVISHCPKEEGLNFMTLPNLAFNVENRLLTYYPKSVALCYEMQRSIWRKAQRICPRNVIMVNENIFNHEHNYINNSFVWLDFCNSYTDEFMTRIITLLERIKFADKAVLSITLAKARGQAEEDMEYNKYYSSYKDEGIAQHLLQFLPPVKKVTRIKYICSDICTRGMPMNVFNFLIDKCK